MEQLASTMKPQQQLKGKGNEFGIGRAKGKLDETPLRGTYLLLVDELGWTALLAGIYLLVYSY